MTSSLIGHADIIHFFEKTIASQRLSHAYCFVGSPEIGKRTVAETIATVLFGVNRDALHTMPDYIVLQRLFDEKKEKTKKDITVEQIQELRQFLQGRPFLKQWKIAVIDGAEHMNGHAANALLKTLEEPSDHSLLFLLVTDDTALPETIRSRCQSIYFSRAKKDELLAYCEEQSVPANTAEEMVRFSLGLPGRLRTWVEDREQFEIHKKEVRRFVDMLGRPFHEKVQAVEELFGDKTDHVAARNRLLATLDIWQVTMRDLILEKDQIDENRYAWTTSRLVRARASLLEAKRMLQENVHPRLLIERVLIHLP